MTQNDATTNSAIGLTWSRGKLQNVPACPACRSHERTAESYSRRDDSSSMPDWWNIVTCANCATLYLDPRPDDESLPRAYDSYFTHSRADEVFPERGFAGIVWSLINGYLNASFGMSRHPSMRLGAIVFRLAVPWRQKLDHYCRGLHVADYPSRGLLLDLGCGNGGFLERAREMGWEAMGCEPDRSAVDVCRNAGLDVVHGDVFDEQLDRRQFDVVTANHVIEHVTDVERTLSRIHSIVKPGGTVWFAFPNPDCLSLKLFKAAAVILHIPYHLCMPSQRRFCEMLECAGFTDARVTRRGVQSKSNWIHSAKIAEEQGLPQPARLKVWLARLLSEMLSVFSGKWGEETVFVARKM